MKKNDDVNAALHAHPWAAHVNPPPVIQVASDGPRIVKIGVVTFLGLLIWWPLLLLTIAFVVPAIVISAVIAVVVAAIAVPSWLLVRRVRSHHPALRSTRLPHRPLP